MLFRSSSPHPPVSVYGTGPCYTIAAFLDRNTLGQWETKLYRNGVKLRPEQTGIKDLSEDKLYRVYGSDNIFLGIGAFHEGSFRSFKNF